MSKIVQAVNIMISNPNKITNLLKRENEIFFLYLGKQKWSINKNEKPGGIAHYSIFYYPGDKTLDQLARITGQEWEHENYVTYSTDDIKTREALESFKQLYTILNEKISGIDDIFQEIIDSNEPEPF